MKKGFKPGKLPLRMAARPEYGFINYLTVGWMNRFLNEYSEYLQKKNSDENKQQNNTDKLI